MPAKAHVNLGPATASGQKSMMASLCAFGGACIAASQWQRHHLDGKA